MKLNILAMTVLLAPLWLPVSAKAENPTHMRQLLSTKACSQCDLSNAGLAYAKLSKVNLQGADLSRANLSRVDLSNADLRNANLSGASLVGANLSGANLSGANLSGADLREAYLLNTDFTGSTLAGTNLRKTIALPPMVVNTEEFYRWGLEEFQKGNHAAAINNYNQALDIDTNFAPAYMGRGVSRYQLGDAAGAMEDSKLAAKLFLEQENTTGYESAQQFIKGLETAQEQAKQQSNPGGGGFLQFLGSLGSLLLPLLF